MSKLDGLRSDVGGFVSESMGRGVIKATIATDPGNPGRTRYSDLKKLSGAQDVPVDQIEADPLQPRRLFPPDEMKELEDSIREHGVLQPIRVYWSDRLDRYVILMGERRFRASQAVGKTRIPCIIHDAPMTDGERLMIQVVENMQRLDLAPIDQANAFKRLMDFEGWSARRLAEALHVSHMKVNRALELLDAPAPIQEAVAAGRLTAAAARELARVDDVAIQAEMTEAAIAGEISGAEVKVIRARSPKPKAAGKGRGGKPKPPPTVRTDRASSGYKVTIEYRRGIDPALALAALEEIAAKIRAEQGGEAEAA